MNRKSSRWRLSAIAAIAGSTSLLVGSAISAGTAVADQRDVRAGQGMSQTATPIKHLVVLFQENVSFDHYYATYPRATNTDGQPFAAKEGTPTVNGLSAALLTANPNGANPQRLKPTQALTCDQDHGYSAEQSAFDNGLMDSFIKNTGASLSLSQCLSAVGNTAPVTANQDPSNNYAVMDYYDGNTVTGMWNYAQNFAMSDNSYGTNFGPSTPGAVNVTAANTYGVICGPTSATYWPSGTNVSCSLPNGVQPNQLTTGESTGGAPTPAGPATDTSDADPYFDVCSYLPSSEGGDNRPASKTIEMGGSNIGDLLNSKGITWGWFEGGFDNGYIPGNGTAPTTAQICSSSHNNVGGNAVTDYIPHHEPFQYYASTANPQHLPPTSVAAVGHKDQANHQYDLADFWAAADSGNLPSVSYIKAPAYQDGHAGYSDPFDEQNFLVNTINHLEKLPSWKSTAVVINYDDSDGWYDHQMSPITSESQTSLDTLTGTGTCGSNPALVPVSSTGQPEQAKCGSGPRLPLMVISPYSKANFVDNTYTTQSSIVQFIEDNWLAGERLGNGAADNTSGSLNRMFNFDRDHGTNPPLFLDPVTGEPIHSPQQH